MGPRRVVLVFALAVAACSPVRPPAVSEAVDELARAPIPGAASEPVNGAAMVQARAPFGVEAGVADPAAGAPPGGQAGPAVLRDAGPPPGDGAPVRPIESVPPMDLGPVGSITTGPDERPLDDGPQLQLMGELLWKALVEDDPEVAARCFFPREVYVHVKAAKNPEGDWRWRLWKNFERDVHALSKVQGKALRAGAFKGLRIPAKKPHWAPPGTEYNRLGYWRVFGAQLVYELRGRERFVPISSMISWKRTWYVVHFTGFR